jgi:hypothetical protein
MNELEKALNIADLNYQPLTWDERHSTVEAAFTELAELLAYKAAAQKLIHNMRLVKDHSDETFCEFARIELHRLESALDRKPSA